MAHQCSILNNSGPKKKKTKQKESDVEKKFLEYLDVQTQKGINNDKQDQHQEFFNSLLPIVRKFNDDQTLLFRSEVIKIAQTIIKGCQTSSLPEKIKPNIPSKSFQHQPYFHQPPYSPYRMYNPNNQQYIHPQQTSSQYANTQYNILPAMNTSLYVQSQHVQNVHSLQPPVQNYASSQHINVVSPESPHLSNASSSYSTSTLSHHSDIVPGGRDEIYSDSDIMDEFLLKK